METGGGKRLFQKGPPKSLSNLESAASVEVGGLSTANRYQKSSYGTAWFRSSEPLLTKTTVLTPQQGGFVYILFHLDDGGQSFMNHKGCVIQGMDVATYT